MKKTLLTALGTALIASAAQAQDTCGTATALPDGNNVGVVVDNTGLTHSGVQPSCGSGTGLILDQWFSWSPSIDGDAEFSTCNMSNDTRIAVYTSCGGVQLGCNDDATGCATNSSLLSITGVLDANTYFIQVGGWSGGAASGTMDVTEMAPPPPGFGPASDECATATAIPNGEQLIEGLDTSAATTGAEVSTCDGLLGATISNDVWLSWTPDCSGDYLFSTCNMAGFDTNLGLWSSACGSEIACNEDTFGCSGFSTELTGTALVGGTSYAIRVGGYSSGDAGLTDLEISCTTCAAPANDECATATVLPAGAQTLIGIDNCTATTSPDVSGCAGLTDGGAGPFNDVWFEWSPDVDGVWAIGTCNLTAIDSNLGLWDACGGTEIACDEDTSGCAGFTTELQACLSASSTYLVRLGGWGAGDTGPSDLDFSLVPVSNDECLTATSISGELTTAFSNSGATDSGVGFLADVWYEWTPDFSGDYTISTSAPFTTSIVVWNACPSMAGGPIVFGIGTSTVSATGLNPISYWISVAGAGAGDVGCGDLTITCDTCVPPANDVCSGATPMVEGANAHDHGNFSTPSGVMPTGLPPYIDDAAPDTACQDFGAPDNLNTDNWYTFTAAANSGYTFDACNAADYDSKLALYSGDCGSLVPLACNDDGLDPTGASCMGFTSQLNVTGLNEGQTYLLQVGGFGGADSGTATVTISRRAGTQNYCSLAPNSVGAGAVMASSGSTSILADDLVLECSGLPDDFALFFYGFAKDNFAAAGFNGVTCVNNPLRLPTAVLVSGGSMSRAVTQAELGSPAAGTSVFFQAFYRDGAGGGAGANTSDGLSVTMGL